MAFTLSPLPYPETALEPHMSARTLQFHHGKHHQTYVDTLNRLVDGKPEAKEPLEQIITATYHDESKAAVFNAAAQVWNHDFFWKCMTPNGGGEPTGALADAIAQAFGNFAKFADAFETTSVGQFGSGWGWLVFDAGKIKLIRTPNAVTPLAGGQTALLTCDVWEHAYYLDYQNRRADFVRAFLEHLVNWPFVAANLANAMQPRD